MSDKREDVRSDRQRQAESDEDRRRREGELQAGPSAARPLSAPPPSGPLNPVTGQAHSGDLPRGQVFRTGLSGVDHSLPIDPPPPASAPRSMGTPEERERAASPETAGAPRGGVAVGPSRTAEAAVPNPGDQQRQTMVDQGAFPTGSEDEEREARGGTDLGDSSPRPFDEPEPSSTPMPARSVPRTSTQRSGDEDR